MSVITKRGDDGETDLMYGRRVAKTHPRMIANGSVDELSTVLGIVRVHAHDEQPGLAAIIGTIQQQLILLMGELATAPEDWERYQKDGFDLLSDASTDALTAKATALEHALNERFRDWAIPGESLSRCSAYLDHARAVCRRAERETCALAAVRPIPQRYLNRLADYLWLLARASAKGSLPDTE